MFLGVDGGNSSTLDHQSFLAPTCIISGLLEANFCIVVDSIFVFASRKDGADSRYAPTPAQAPKLQSS